MKRDEKRKEKENKLIDHDYLFVSFTPGKNKFRKRNCLILRFVPEIQTGYDVVSRLAFICIQNLDEVSISSKENGQVDKWINPPLSSTNEACEYSSQS